MTSRYWDKVAVAAAVLGVFGALVGVGVAEIAQKSASGAFAVSAMVPTLSYFAWRLFICPSMTVGEEALAVRNSYTLVRIPWNQVSRFSWEGRLRVHLHGGGVVRVGAFADWPARGREGAILAELRSARDRWAPSGTGEVAAKRHFGVAELLLLGPMAVVVVLGILKGS